MGIQQCRVSFPGVGQVHVPFHRYNEETGVERPRQGGVIRADSVQSERFMVITVKYGQVRTGFNPNIRLEVTIYFIFTSVS